LPLERNYKLLNGYALVKSPKHPKAMKDGWYWEHILVAENKINRRLKPHESVHHINQIKTDNREENLFVCTRSEHDKAHGMKTVSFYKLKDSWVCKKCEGCGKTFYGPPSIIKKRKKCNSQCRVQNVLEKVCNYCYNIYTIPVEAEKHYKFCSKLCRQRSKTAA
jgi:hypothetical protein